MIAPIIQPHFIRQVMSRDTFLTMPETMLRNEYIQGEAYMSPPPDPDHQLILGDVHFRLHGLKPSGKLILSPQDIYFGDDILQPDLFWIREGGTCIRVEKHWEGAPDLVIEVLSPSTGHIDRGKKYRLYEQHGVREYWLIDPLAQFVEVYALTNGKFIRQDLYEKNASFVSPVLGNQTIVVSQLFVV